MRSLTKAPIEVAGVVFWGTVSAAGWRTLANCDSETRLCGMAIAVERGSIPILEGASSLAGRLAFRPTKEYGRWASLADARRPKRQIAWKGGS